MSNDVDVKIKVTADMDKAIKGSKIIKDNLKGAADAATATSKAVSSIKPASQTKAYAAAAKGATSSTENVGYGIARSVSTGTGAAGRDFAKQAQGLGGLVHVYATFAANLFAVGAAFTALKNAADTSNMIKGLDQLGAASGRNLGGLSKEVVRLTDGAVSLRDAMEAVGKASSSGMSDANIKRLATGASQASKVLGVGMADALSRLSRGIAKIEPELLDEIGIFVRVDKAAQDYARSLGKPVSALTDFERRAGFANAVLDQMDQKFGKIEMAANPYDKLSASLKDVMQTGLDLVNKVLTPVIKLLSESPTGLVTALLAVGAMLVKQAVPTVGAIKENMKMQADQARELANIKLEDAKNALNKEVERNAAAAKKKAEDSIKTTKAQLLQEHSLRKAAADAAASDAQANVEAIREQLVTLKKEGSFKKTSKAFAILDKPFTDVTDKDIGTFSSLEKQFSTKGDTEKAKAYAQAGELLKQHIGLEKEYQRVVQEGLKIEEHAKSKQIALEDEYKKNLEASRAEVEKTVASLPVSKAASDANAAAKGREIAANASYTTSILGMKAGWKELNEELKKAKASGEMTGMQAGVAKVRGSLGILTQGVSSFLGAWGVWGQAIAAGAVVLSFVADYLSNTTKEAKETEEAIKSLSSGVENLTRTLDFINKKSVSEFLSVESIQARATAIGELGNSMVAMLQKADAQFGKMNWFDKGMNFVKSMFNEDLASDIGEGMGKSLSKAMEGIDLNKNSKALEGIRSSLGVSSLFNEDEVSKAFTKLERGGEAGRKKAEELAKQMQAIGMEAQVAAAKATEFKQSLEQTAKSFKTFSNSFIPSDNFSKLGADIMTQASKMTLALEEPATAIASMYELTKNPENIALLPKESQQAAIDMRVQIKGMAEDYSLVNKQIHDMTVELEKNKAKLAEFDAKGTVGKGSEQYKKVKTEIANLEKVLEDTNRTKSSQEAGINEATSQFAVIAKAQFVAGAAIIGERLSAEWAKVGTAVGNTVAGILGNTKSGIELRAQYEKQQLAGQASLIKSQQELIKSNYLVAETIRLNDIGSQLREGKSSKTGKALDEKETAALQQDAVKRADSIYVIQSGKMQGMAKRMGAEKEKYTQEAIQAAQSLEGTAAQIAAIMDQIASVDLRKKVDEAKRGLESDKEREKALGDSLALRKELIGLIKLDSDFTSESSSAEASKLDSLILQSKQKQEQLELEKQRVSFKTIIEAPETNAQQKSAAQKELGVLNSTTAIYMAQRQEQELKVQASKNEMAILQDKFTVETKLLKMKQEESAFDIEIAKEKLNTSKIRLDVQKKDGIMSEVDYTKKSFEIRKEGLLLEEEERIASIEAAKAEFKVKSRLIQAQYSLIAAQAKAEEKSYLAKAAAATTKEEKDSYNSAASISGETASTINYLAKSAQSQADQTIANYDRQIERQKILTTEKQKQLAIEEQSATRMARMTDLTSILGNVMGEGASKITPILSAFSALATSLETSKLEMTELNAKSAELDVQGKSIADNELKIAASRQEAYDTGNLSDMLALNEKQIENDNARLKNDDDKIKNNKKIGESEEKNIERGVDGTMALLSASKKLFKEKSTANKVISAMEKAYMGYKLAMMAKEMAMSVQQTITALTSSAAITTAKTGETTANAAASISAAGSGDPYTGIARVIAMIALMGVALGMIGKSAPSGGSGPSAEDLQKVQGTGMDYVDGQLVENGGGALGDAYARSEDIANSLDYIESHTNKTLQYDNKMLDALKAIEINTADFVASLYSAGLLGLKSPFGTKDTETQNMGKLGIGFMNSGSTTSKKVTDRGITINGTVGDIVKETARALLYETVTKTSTSSGYVFGLVGKKSSTSKSTKTQALDSEATGQIADIYNSAITAILKTGETLGTLSADAILERLNAVTVKINLSTFGITGEEASQALLAEVGVSMNLMIDAVFPFLSKFQKLGEGLLTTVTRVVTDMETVNLVFEQMGVDISKSLKPWELVDTKASEDTIKLEENTIAYNNATAAINAGIEDFISKSSSVYGDTSESALNGIERPIKDILAEKLGVVFTDAASVITYLQTHSSRQIEKALRGIYSSANIAGTLAAFKGSLDGLSTITGDAKEIQARLEEIANSNIVSNLEAYKYLTDRFGGADEFSEAMGSYIDNFLSEAEKTGIIVSRVSGKMTELGYASVNTKKEFTALVNSFDPMTKAGADALKKLLDVQEGFLAMTDVADKLASKVKLAASDFTTILTDALMGKITESEIGTKVATGIQDGILQALAASYIEDIANSISAELITPLITSISESAITGSIATVLISETAMESIIAKAQRTAAVLDTIFNNVQFQGLLTTMTNTITTAVTAIRRPTAGAAADLSKLGIAASNFSSVLKDGILGNIAVSEIGEKVATMIEEGIITSLTSAAIDSITSIITQQIITPIITSLTTGAAITTVVSQSSIDAMIDAAVAASRTLAAVFSDAGFMESIREVSTIIGDTFAQTAAVAQITSGTISKVLKKLSAGNTGLINAYKSQVTALESARQKFVDFAKTLREFAASLRLSDLSPLTPAEKYAQAQADFESTARLAQSGDETALGKLQSVSQSFLDISRGYYASTSQYTTDFNRVQQVLESSASAADAIVSDIDRQIGIAKSQLAVLGYIEENTADIASAIDKANAEVEKARQETKVAVADTLIRSFTTLDENVNGLLTKNELGALGLATDGELNDVFNLLDTNGDGQISLLETLNSSSKNTVMAVNDLNPILSDIRAGTRTTADAQTYLRLINEALVASGRSAIDGGSGYIDRGGSGTFTGGTDTGTGTGTGTNMYGDAAANRVSSIFRTLFNRSPNEAGLDYWSKSLRAGSSTEDSIFGNILAGAQGTDKGKAAVWLDSYITSGYRAILNRAPETGGLTYWKEKALNGAVHVKDLYRIIAQSASVGSNLNDKSSAQTWLAANPNYIAKLASGGRHSSGARIVGEQGPELEMTGPSRIWSFEQTRNMLRPLGSNDSGTDAELLAEIRKLNAKIDSLERTVAAGDMINADATERNTREVSGTVREATSTTIHASRMQKKATIV